MSMKALYPNELDILKPEIRLLEVSASKDAKEISCRLETVKLEKSKLQFTALSYVWGDPNVTTNIELNGFQVPVVANLAAALQNVRKYWELEYPDREPHSFRIWVDALCINQGDIKERAAQVKLMPQIYSAAELVLGWLGDTDTEEVTRAALMLKVVARALSLLPPDFKDASDLQFLKSFTDLIRPPECDKNWRSLNVIGLLPYWSRAWILQENVLASKVYYINKQSILGSEFVIGVSTALNTFSRLLLDRHIPKPDFIPSHVWLALCPPNGMDCMQLSNIIRLGVCKNLFNRRSKTAEVGKRMRDDLTLSQFGGTLLASDPKDHIYALLGLHSLGIEVDYSKNKRVRDVYIDYCRVVLDNITKLDSKDLFFLRDAGIGAFENKYDLPSWAPNFPERSGDKPTLIFGGKFKLYSLMPGDLLRPNLSGSVLSIPGICLTTIGRVGQPPLLKSWRKGGSLFEWTQDYITRHPTYPVQVPTLWALFQTVTRMQELHFDTPTMALLLDFLLHLDFDIPNIDATTPMLNWSFKTPEEAGLSIMVIWNGRDEPQLMPCVSPFIGIENPSKSLDDRTMEVRYRLNRLMERNYDTKIFEVGDGHLGLGPEGCAAGDIVCLIHGYEDLVLLRKFGTQYQYVGPCLITGISESFIRSGVDRRNLELETFDLV